MAVAFEWKKVETFDEFLDEFERYVNEYFTKNVILVNRVKLETLDGGDILLFEVSTPSIDIILKIYTPDKVILDSYFTDFWMGGSNHIYDDWNGLVLTEEQFSRFLKLARRMVDYYEGKSDEFRKARSEAFMNLIAETKGKVIDVLEEALGEETATLVVAKELDILPKERDGRGNRIKTNTSQG